MQMLYVTEAVMLYWKNYPNTPISLKTILSIFFSANSSSVSVIFHKKIGLSVKGNHDRAEKYIDLFKVDSEKNFPSVHYCKSRRYVQHYKGCKMSN